MYFGLFFFSTRSLIKCITSLVVVKSDESFSVVLASTLPDVHLFALPDFCDAAAPGCDRQLMQTVGVGRPWHFQSDTSIHIQVKPLSVAR